MTFLAVHFEHRQYVFIEGHRRHGYNQQSHQFPKSNVKYGDSVANNRIAPNSQEALRLTSMTPKQSPFKAPLSVAFNAALHHVETLNQYAVSATSSLAEVRRNLAKPLNEEGISADEVLCDLIRDTQGGTYPESWRTLLRLGHRRSVPAASGSGLAYSGVGPKCRHTTCSPAAAVVEEVAGSWLKDSSDTSHVRLVRLCKLDPRWRMLLVSPRLATRSYKTAAGT